MNDNIVPGCVYDGEGNWLTYAEAVATCHNSTRDDQWALLESLLEACRDGEPEAKEPFKKLLDILM